MNKNWIYFLVLLVCVGLVYFVVFKNKSDGYPDFNYPVEKLSQIYMTDQLGNSINLVKIEDKWFLDSSINPNEEMLTRLLHDIETQYALLPIQGAILPTIKMQLQRNQTKVELYDMKGVMVKRFFVGNPDESDRGNYMLADGDNTIYDVTTPDAKSSMTYDYYTNHEEWKSKYVINMNPDEISSIELVYTDSPQNSFLIENKSPIFSIIGQPSISKPADQARLREYFRFFEKLPLVSRANQNVDREYLMRPENKIADLKVTGVQGKTTHLVIFYHPQTRRSKNLQTSEPDPNMHDPDYLFVYNPEANDFMLAQIYTFGKVLRSYKDFFALD